jgi:ADP-heptose:LPS heptosyltransferase
VARRLAAAGILPGERIMVLHPGTGGSSFDWPAERLGALGARLAQEPRTRIIVSGIGSERALCDAAMGAMDPEVRALSVCGELSLPEMIALLDRSTLLAANSTGVLHVAAALGTPVLGFYPLSASHSPARWGPYTKRAAVLTPPPEAPDAMELITVEEALAAARKLLSETPR